MYTEFHGGACCGMHHIVDFGSSPNDRTLREFKRELERFPSSVYDDEGVCIDGYESRENHNWYYGDYNDEYVKTDKKFSCVLEATLTDQQMVGWAPVLKEAGFRVVNRFLNSNSGNVVNVLHYNPAGRRKIPKPPYKW